MPKVAIHWLVKTDVLHGCATGKKHMQYQDESLQQQLDALREEMAAKTEFYKHQCAQRMGARLRQRFQAHQQPHWHLRSKRLQYRIRYWSSRLFIGIGQLLLWSGQLLVKVGHRLAPDAPRAKVDVTPPEESVVNGAYQVIEAKRENPHAP